MHIIRSIPFLIVMIIYTSLNFAMEQENQNIWIKTKDNKVINLPKWKVEQMHALYIQDSSQDSPLDGSICTEDEFQLISHTLDAIAQGSFDQLYTQYYDEYEKSLHDKTIGEGNLRRLIRVAGDLKAMGVILLCAKQFLPQDMHRLIALDVLKEVNDYCSNYPNMYLNVPNAPIKTVLFTPDGTQIVSGAESDENNLMVWDPQTGQRLFNLQGHPHQINTLACSADSTLLLAGNSTESEKPPSMPQKNILFMIYRSFTRVENNAIVWDLKTGKRVQNLLGQDGSIWAASFNPTDTNQVATGGSGNVYTNNLSLWDIQTGQKIYNLQPAMVGPHGNIWSLAWSPDGKMIVAGRDDNRPENLVMWDASTGAIARKFPGMHNITSVTFNYDGSLIAAGGGLGTAITPGILKVWNVHTGQLVQDLVVHQDRILKIAFTPGGSKLITCSQGPSDNLAVLDMQTGQIVYNLKGHLGNVNSIVISKDGKKLVSCSDGHMNNLLIWDLETGNLIHNLKGHTNDVNSVDFSLDNKTIVSGSSDKKHNLIVWNLKPIDEMKLDLEQMTLLYGWYLSALSGNESLIVKNSRAHVLFMKLPPEIQRVAVIAFKIKIQ